MGPRTSKASRARWVLPALVLSPPALAVLALAFGPSRDARPHIVLVCIDTLRADHTSVHGYGRDTTPHMARLAAEGLVARRHHASGPWTKPSVASMITGLHPSAHGSREGKFVAPARGRESSTVEVLSERHHTLAEILSDAGYDTRAHVTNVNMLEKFGYAQGYAEYVFVPNATAPDVVNASDRAAVEYAREALVRARRPTFVWVHLMSVHQYAAPLEMRRFEVEGRTRVDREAPAHGRMRAYEYEEQALADYDASILFADSLVGELAEFARGRNTVLVVTSDHGEEFHEHGGYEHGTSLYGELVRVPLVIAGPGVPRGEVTGLSDTLDLLPTIAALAGVEDVESRLPHARRLFADGRPRAGKDVLFLEQHARTAHRRHAVVEADGKLIRRTRKNDPSQVSWEFYADPLGPELDEGYAALPHARAERLRADLERLGAEARAWFDEHVGGVQRATVGVEDVAAFKALGYAGGEDEER